MIEAEAEQRVGRRRRCRCGVMAAVGVAAAVVLVAGLMVGLGRGGGRGGGTTAVEAAAVDVAKKIESDGSFSLIAASSVGNSSDGVDNMQLSGGGGREGAAAAGETAPSLPGLTFRPHEPPVPSPSFPETPAAALAAAKAAAAAAAAQATKEQQASPPQEDSNEPDACYPQTADELTAVVQQASGCSRIFLTNQDPAAYTLADEITVSRHVVIQGHPIYLPIIDAGAQLKAVRAFRVVKGGYLDLQHVRIRQGVGELRDRFSFSAGDAADDRTGGDEDGEAEAEGEKEEAPAADEEMGSKIIEIRGGCVAVEQGAAGSNFEGVIFLSVANTPASVQGAIRATFQGIGGRIYGGIIFIAAGSVSVTNCHFWSTSILLPLTDQISVGGDVLMIAGQLYVTASTFTSTMLFSSYIEAGMTIAVLGGIGVFTFGLIQNQCIAKQAGGVGHLIFVAGGVQILTGFDFRLVAATLCFTGFGSYATGAGVLIMTGVTITNAYGLLFAAGAGFYTGVGSGVLVQTGVTYAQFDGPTYNAFAGGSVFLGTGTSINIGVPSHFSSSTTVFQGIGGFSYNGAGVSVWVGSPCAVYAASYAFHGLGGLTAQSVGFLTWVGSPAFIAIAMEHFAGLGGVLWEGAGAAVVALSPVYAPTFLLHTDGNSDNFYVAGNSFVKGKGLAYVDRTKIVTTNSHNNGTTRRRMVRRRLAKEQRGITIRTSGGGEESTSIRRRRRIRSAAALFAAAKGKRYLKSDKVGLPFPWDWEQQLSEKQEEGGESSSRIYMYKTKSFETVDFANAEVKGALVTWVPEKMLAAAESMQTEFKAIIGKNGARSLQEVDTISRPALQDADGNEAVMTTAKPVPSDPERKPRNTLYVEEGTDACQICDVDSVAGPGAGQCEHTPEACAKLFRNRGDPDKPAAVFDYDDINFEPSHIVMGSLTPIATALAGDENRNGTRNSRLFDANDLRDALRAWLRDQAGFPGTHVTVFSTAPDELTSRWLSENPDAKSAAVKRLLQATTPSCPSPKLHQFTVAFVAHEQEAADALAQALQETEDEEGHVSSSISSVLAGLSWPDKIVCTVGSSLQRRLIIPAYNSRESLQVPSFFQEQLEREKDSPKPVPTPLLSTIRLVDPSRPGLPFAGGLHQDVVLGREYSLLLSGFPLLKPVEVSLVDASGKRTGGNIVESFHLTTNKRGAATHTWAVPPTLPPGDYFLQAGEEGKGGGVTSPWRFSSVYTVALKARRRKLYGPIWWVGDEEDD